MLAHGHDCCRIPGASMRSVISLTAVDRSDSIASSRVSKQDRAVCSHALVLIGSMSPGTLAKRKNRPERSIMELPVREAKARLSELAAAARNGKRVIITRHGRPPSWCAATGAAGSAPTGRRLPAIVSGSGATARAGRRNSAIPPSAGRCLAPTGSGRTGNARSARCVLSVRLRGQAGNVPGSRALEAPGTDFHVSAVSIREMRLKFNSRHRPGQSGNRFSPGDVVTVPEDRDLTFLPVTMR